MDNPSLYTEEREMNYATDDEYDYESNEVVDELHEKFDDMSMQEKRNFIQKVYTDKQVDRELLRYELKHYSPKVKCQSLEEMVNYTKKTLSRYQWRAGGFYIEDSEWEEHDENSPTFSVKEGEYLFLNSVDKKDAYELSFKKFLLLLEKHLNKATKKFRVKIMLEEKKSITFVYLYLKKN